MKKVNLNNLYEAHYPPTDINVLWVDKDEVTGKIRAILEYNKAKGEWEPYMVSVDYMKPTLGGQEGGLRDDNDQVIEFPGGVQLPPNNPINSLLG